jgi:Tol biopolymer transport system component
MFFKPVGQPAGEWIAAEGAPAMNFYPEVFLIHPSTGEVSPLPGVQGTANPAWLPDGESLSYSVSGIGIQITKPFSAMQEVSTLLEKGAIVSWSPDGRYVAIETNMNTTTPDNFVQLGAAITIVDLKTQEERVVYQTPATMQGLLHGMAWSPSSDQLAFAAYWYDDRSEKSADGLFTVRLDGTDLRSYPVQAETVWTPGWTHDGKWLFYVDGGVRLENDDRLSFVSVEEGCEVDTDVVGISSPSLAPGWDHLIYDCDGKICLLDLKGLLGDHYEKLVCK